MTDSNKKLSKQEQRFVRFLGSKVKKELSKPDRVSNEALYPLMLGYERKEWAVQEYLSYVEVVEGKIIDEVGFSKTWKVDRVDTIYNSKAQPILRVLFAPYVEISLRDATDHLHDYYVEAVRILEGDEVTVGIADAYIRKHTELENFYEKRKAEIAIHVESANEIQKKLDEMADKAKEGTVNQDEYFAKSEEMQFHIAEANVLSQCLLQGSWDESSLNGENIDLTHFKSSNLLFQYEMEEYDLHLDLLKIIVHPQDADKLLNELLDYRKLLKFINFGESLLGDLQPIAQFEVCDLPKEELEAMKKKVEELTDTKRILGVATQEVRKYYASLLEASEIKLSELSQIFIEKKFLSKYFSLKKKFADLVEKRKGIVENHAAEYKAKMDELQERMVAVNKGLSLAKTELQSASRARYRIEANPENITFKQFTEAKKMLENAYQKTGDEAKDGSRLQLASTLVALSIAQGADKQEATDKAVALTGMLFENVQGFNALAWLVAMVCRKEVGFQALEPFDVAKVHRRAKMFQKRLPVRTAYGVFAFFLSLKQPSFNQNSTS